MIKNILIKMIRYYQRNLSGTIFKGSTCKFRPTCSEYMIQSIEKKGVIRGLFAGIYRLLRCNPFSKGGYDPVK